MPTSQNGWTALAAGSPLLHTWQVPTDTKPTPLTLRQGSAGFLLCHLALWFAAKVEALVEPVFDDWSYSYRPIRGYDTGLSNHSSGTAVDLNATDHPLAVDGTFTPAELKAVHRRLGFYEVNGAPLIRWGQDYHSRKDGMHFEIIGDLADCETRARALLDTPRGKAILAANPGQRAVILS